MVNINRVEMPSLDAKVRQTNFNEVATGYTKEDALLEASRCLNCKNPLCVKGCPVNIDIPGFISLLKEDNVNAALAKIKEQSAFPGICGRVCPQEKQCEGKCVRGIKGESVAIGRLERYVADNGTILEEPLITKNNKSVAVVGSGPAGLAFAGEALNKGYDVTIYEALHCSGGVLVYGIPEFRLPKSIVKKEIDSLVKKGAKIINNVLVGKSISLEELKKNNDYVFLGLGAGVPRFMNIPGENLNGVQSANEFLTRVNLMKAYIEEYDTPIKHMNNVVVVGGGNVAMDAARCAKRLGANVSLVYRRSLDEMPARLEEVHHAMEEDINFLTLTNPICINGNEEGNVVSVTCNTMELGEPDASGRRSPIVKEGCDVTINCDTVIMAIGNYPNPVIRNSTDMINFSDKGLIIVNEDNETSYEGIFAGGDITTGAATVILAMGAGKKAASKI